MERPPPAFGGAPPAAVRPPSTMVSQFQPPIQHPIQHMTAEQLMSVGMYTVPEQASSPMSMSINIGSMSPGYSPPAGMSPIQHQAIFPPVAPFPPPGAQSSGGVFNLMRRVPVSETFRLSHPLTSHPQSPVSWVTQPQTPPVYPFPPPRFPHPPLPSLPSSPATVQVPSFSQLASECVLPSVGYHGPLQHADVHSMQPPVQQVTPEMCYLEPQFVVEPLQHLSHAPNPQYSHQWPSHASHYWSASTGTTSHQQQVERRSHVAGHSRHSAQIARPIPVYRYPMPGYTRPSTSIHEESSSTSMREESPPTSVHDASPREIGAEDGAQEDSRGQLETPSEAKIQSDAKELDEYKEFATAFKSHRLKMGYSQADVMQQVAIRYGACISQERVDRFEGLQLTITAVRTLKATLEQWVRDTAKASGTSEEEIKEIIVSPTTSINPKRERKRRTSVDACIKDELEAEFQRKRKPTKVEMGLIATRLRVDKDFVRIWFCNRRQRQKKRESATTTVGLRGSSDTDAIKIPSPSHDITVEVPPTSQEGAHTGSCQAAVYIT